jgi:CBS domain containing-hemolysin-like protein
MTGRDGEQLLSTGAHPSTIADAPLSVVVEETDAQRLDREHDQLYQELRALITGVQVLFGFLLSVTFTTRFTDLSTTDRRIHLAVIGCAATALVLLLAPTAFHRVQFRQRDKEAMVRIANVEALVAMIFIALSTGGTLYLVAAIAFGTAWGVSAATALFGFSILMWWVIPLARRRRQGT